MNNTKTILKDNIIGFFESDELDEVEKEFNELPDEEINPVSEQTDKRYLNANPQVSSSTPNYKTANPVIKKIKTKRIDWSRDDLSQKMDLSNPYDTGFGENYNY